jgi:hypothetical protein
LINYSLITHSNLLPLFSSPLKKGKTKKGCLTTTKECWTC